jgi:hypothetical protein
MCYILFTDFILHYLTFFLNTHVPLLLHIHITNVIYNSTGPNHYPSPIVAKIMERLRHRGDRDFGSIIDGQSVASAPAATTVNSEPVPDSPTIKLSPQQRFASAVQKVQQSKSVLTRIQSWKTNNQQPVS